MADWSTPLASLLTIGSSAGLLGLAKYIQDERTHRAERRRLRRAEEREDGEEPLKVEELHLGLVSQATAIQQRMIDTQKQQIQDLDLRYELLKTDSDRQIGALRAQNAAQESRIAEQDGQIGRLARRMAAMELELEQYRTAGGAA
jgi:hypothetical protein